MTQNTPPGDRIAKVIARAGLASRREAEQLILQGRVSVNGKVINSPALNVTTSDKVVVNGKIVGAPDEARIWLYHKPVGLVTTTKDEQGRPTIFDKLPEDLPRVMSVGRLDLNSEGLLLLTNDGGVKRKLELPSTGWLRKYRVRVKGQPKDETLEPLRKGLVIDGERFQPMIVTLDRQQGANAWLTVGLREGKNREIRRAMADLGLTVNRLIRVSYGPFQLGQLKAGAVEELRRKVVRDQLGLDSQPDETTAKPKKSKGNVVKRKPRPARPGAKRSGKTP
jgi:23S rRNA pseudouridine2605 synthase